jgi:hypothetical protein
LAILDRENLHSEVYKHAKGSFQHEKYTHSVFEVCKAFDKAVQDKAQLQKTGRSLMQEAWAWKSNMLRATTGTSDSDESFHEGLKLHRGTNSKSNEGRKRQILLLLSDSLYLTAQMFPIQMAASKWRTE